MFPLTRWNAECNDEILPLVVRAVQDHHRNKPFPFEVL
jgi:hypothetical protein